MNQFNPQSGFGYDARLHETKPPQQIRPEVGKLLGSFKRLHDSLLYQYHEVVAPIALPLPEDDLDVRSHSYNPVRESNLSIVTPEYPTETVVDDRDNEMRKMEEDSLREIEMIHDQNQLGGNHGIAA